MPSRRDLLRTAAASLALGALPALPGCAPHGRPERRRPLAPVRVGAERVIRTVVGLRPFRRPGFRLEAERVGDRTVIHSYGHGGCGVTLSWGVAELAADLAMQAPRPRMAVLGAGVVGLSTARVLQRRGVAVTIYARDVPPHTTSDLAGASFYPGSLVLRERRTPAFEAVLDRAMRLSHRRFQELVGDPRYGVTWRESYWVDDPLVDWPDHERVAELWPARGWLPPGESPFAPHGAGVELTLHIEPPIYLRALVDDFLTAGGALVVRELGALAEVAALPEETIVNCTGLGAGALCGDPEVEPIRGQLHFLPPQPEVDYIVGHGEHYMMPRRDGILLGGSFERGRTELAPDPDVAARILAGHARLFAALRPTALRRPLG